MGRRHNKRTKTSENELKEMEIANKILSGLDYNIEEFTTESTGRGVRATTLIEKNSYVCEYKGTLLKEKELKRLQIQYDANQSVGSFVVYLNSLAGPYKAIDATEEDGSLGRICNHSAKNANCELKLIKFINIVRYGDSEKRPHLYLKTIKDVAKGEELVWNYGETRKSITDCNP